MRESLQSWPVGSLFPEGSWLEVGWLVCLITILCEWEESRDTTRRRDSAGGAEAGAEAGAEGVEDEEEEQQEEVEESGGKRRMKEGESRE